METYYYKGKELSLHKWASIVNICYTTLRARIARGWDIQRALETPKQEQNTPSYITGTKKCSLCKTTLPTKDFVRLKRRTGNEFSSACRSCDRQRTRELRRQARIDIIREYSSGSMSCELCKENRIDVLDLDHINGGGIQERNKFKTPFAFYKWIKDSKYPKGYRILCRNCNWMEWIKRKNQRLL